MSNDTPNVAIATPVEYRGPDVNKFDPVTQKLLQLIDDNYRDLVGYKVGQLLTLIDAMGGDPSTVEARKSMVRGIMYESSGFNGLAEILTQFDELLKNEQACLTRDDRLGYSLPATNRFKDHKLVK